MTGPIYARQRCDYCSQYVYVDCVFPERYTLYFQSSVARVVLDDVVIERRGSYSNCVDAASFLYTKTIEIPPGHHTLLVETTSSAIPKDIIIQAGECYSSVNYDVRIARNAEQCKLSDDLTYCEQTPVTPYRLIISDNGTSVPMYLNWRRLNDSEAFVITTNWPEVWY